MAFILKDRIKEGTTTTGTGDITLGGAAATFETFQSYMTNGDTTYYAIVHTESGVDEWEVGLGTWNTGNTLTRTTVLAGSNGTSAVDFGSGTKDIFMTYPAAHAALAEDDVTFADITVTGTVDGRDVAADGTKLDTVETNADVTDAVNVAAAGALMKSGGTMTGALILNADPTTALGAATKEYVDTIAAAGIHYHTPVRVEAPSALTATYDNGTSGVGATLTNSGTQAPLEIDGVTLSTSDRVLVYNQTNAAHNGVYTVTNTGSPSTNWVLTRATDADSYGASDPNAMGEGDAYFVKEGDTGAGELYVMNTSGTITFGTTEINFTVIAETAVYSAGTGMSLDGTTFSIGQDVGTTASVTFNQVTATIIGNVTGNLTGDVTGNVSGNAGTATKLSTARTIQLTGDVTGNATFDGSANIAITAAVQDDSHAHVISNVDGLQTALNGKVPTSRTITAGTGLTGGGDLSANRTIAHADTSTQPSVNNSNGTVIQDVTLDGFGHVTGLGSLDGDARWVNVTGDTMTGPLVISTGSTNNNYNEGLRLTRANNNWAGITFGSTGNSGAPTGGWFAATNPSAEFIITPDNSSNTTGLTLIKNGAAKWRNNAIFHDGYHPNADKWTTARSHTVTLTGDVTGTATQSVDGTGNKTWTISTTVGNNSHEHTRLQERSGITYGAGQLQWTDLSGSGGTGLNGSSPTNPTSDWYHHILMNHANSGGYYVDLAACFHHDGLYMRRLTNGSLGSWNRFFADNYHPNADKWTTARTLTLSGDASGSVSWDGSANATLSVTVDDDSHTHNKITALGNYGWSASTNGRSFERGIQTSFVRSADGYPDYGSVVRIRTYNVAEDGGTAELYFPYSSTYGGSAMRYRLGQYNNAGWTSWKTVVDTSNIGSYAWTSSNDGSGSGLDADLLDGLHSYQFPRLGTQADGSIYFTDTSRYWLATGGSNNWGIYWDTTNNQIEFHGSGAAKVNIDLDDGNIYTVGNYYAPDKIIHRDDTDTYMQFDAANSWRVVAGGGEKLSTQTNGITITSASGYASFGSSNSSWFHMSTDRPNFYMAQGLRVNGVLGVYNQNTYLSSDDLYLNGNIIHYGDTDTYMQFPSSDNWRVVTGGSERFRVNNSRVTVDTVSPMSFGIPGNGSNTDGRYLSIEGNADGSGEGSGRIFFTEHNSTTASMSNYGFSIGYRGGSTSIVGADGNTWTGLTQIGNGEWGMWGHNNSADGALIMHGDRAATYVDFSGNRIQGTNEIRIGSQVSLKESSDRADLLEITSSTSGWAGIQIRNSSDEGRWSFMTDGSTGGLYDDQNAKWHIQMVEGAGTSLYYNSSVRLKTLATGIEVYSDNTSTGEMISLKGRDNPSINFYETTTLKANIQWDSTNDALRFRNHESDNFDFMPDAATGAVALRLKGSDNDLWGYVYGTDSQEIGFLDEGGSWALRHINDQGTYFYTDGQTEEFKVGRDAVSGDYGTVQTSTTKNGWGGYSISGQWVFMSNGATNAGIFNDSDNEWAFYAVRNAETRMYHNGTEAFRTRGSNSVQVGVSSSTSTNIYMSDNDHGERRIHCNSNRIGFLSSSGNWGGYSDDSGYWWAPRSYVGSASGYFFNDSGSRTAFAGGDFYIQSIGNYYNYATNQYHGNTSGDNHYFRGNALSGNDWSISTAGAFTAVSYSATSDRNLKENIVKIDSALDKVQQLSGYTYNFKDTPDKPSAGLIAQEVQEVLPEAVGVDKNENLSLDYNATIALLVEAIKEQQQRIEELEKRLK